jgi:DNA-binding SARP family transcriptional activator/tetratricopeptide (TPR) repeat protein
VITIALVGCKSVAKRWDRPDRLGFPRGPAPDSPRTLAAVELAVLGHLEMTGPLGPVPVRGAKERVLLAMLAVRANEVVSAHELIDALWADEPPATATKTVQSHVARVRRALESAGLDGVLVTRDPGYVLRVPADCIDAARFEQRLRAGQQALRDERYEEASRKLAAALELWRGDALADCRSADRLDAEAIRLEELRIGALEDRIDADLGCGRHAALVAELESLVTRHPLHERLWGALVIALYRSERQGDALRAYQRARDVLVETLGVEPGAELRDLEVAVLERSPTLDVPARTSSGSAAPSRLLTATNTGLGFVGRDPELAALQDRWREAAGGTRQLALIAGEPGIGKTRLAAELALMAQGDGARVLYGRCDEGLGVPYQPVVEAFREFVEGYDDGDLLPALGRYSGELVRLAPELLDRHPDLPSPMQSDPATEQYRLFEAVTAWLAAASRREPVVLVLDDLHWAARPTILLLRHVARSERPMRLLIVATYRDTELDAPHPLTELLADLRPAGDVARLTLIGLDPRDVAAFVEAAVGRPLAANERDMARTVHSQTAGNPFFVGELVRHFTEPGNGVPPTDALASFRDGGIPVPLGARETVARRVARLTPATQDVLRLAAVIGVEFDVPVLRATARLDDDDLLAALERAETAGLLREVQTDRFGFAHALVRASLYDELSASRRQRIHRRVAGAIEVEYAAALDDHLAALTDHYAIAAPERAVGYAIRAADVALDRLAFEDAVQACDRGLGAVETARHTGADIDRTDECDLLLRRGRALLRAGQPRGRKSLLRAFDVARELGDSERVAQAVLAMNRGFFARVGRTDTELVAALEHAIAAQGDDEGPVVAELLATLASELVFAGDGERRFELSDRALGMARQSGDRRAVARVLQLRSMTIQAPETLAERIAQCDELLAIADELQDPAITFFTAFTRSGTAMETGDVDAANAMVDLASSVAAELREPTLLWQAAFMRTARLIAEGRLDEAEASALATFDLGQRAHRDGEALIFFTEQMLEIRRWQGRLSELLDEFAEFAGVDDFDFGYSLTKYLYDAGEHERARACYERIIEHITLPLRRDMLATTTLGNVAYLAARFGDRARAPAIYDALLPFAAVFGSTTVVRPAGSHFLGVLAATCDRTDDAARHFMDAIGAHDGAKAPLVRAETQLEYARLLRTADADEELVAPLLDDVRTTAKQAGAGYLVSRCDLLA